MRTGLCKSNTPGSTDDETVRASGGTIRDHRRIVLRVLSPLLVLVLLAACDPPRGDDGSGDEPDGGFDDVVSCGAGFVDGDGDGFGAGDLVEIAADGDLGCVFDGFSDDDGDCDDDDALISPVGDDVPSDGVDQDCSGRDACFSDRDDDGFGSRSIARDGERCAANDDDCNDDEATAFPGGVEVAGNNVDEDCDGRHLCFVDGDRDGAGANAAILVFGTCVDDGLAIFDGDCDDADPTRSPLQLEVPDDGLDQDCDGNDSCHADADGDGFGARFDLFDDDNFDCGDGPGVRDTSDCDDGNAAVNPDAVERVGNDVDEDCDGGRLCFTDRDGDGVGTSTTFVSVAFGSSCANAPGAFIDGDCDDGDDRRFPGNPEIVGDDVDEDCDGVEVCFVDRDGDGVGGLDRANSVGGCLVPGFSRRAADCDDRDAHRFGGAVEIENDGIDEDCDGRELCPIDHDGDGFGGLGEPSTVLSCPGSPDVGGDCDDADGTVFPLSACNDGDPCTEDDRCRLGVCAGVPSSTCGLTTCSGACRVCSGANGDCAQRCSGAFAGCDMACTAGATCAFDVDGDASCRNASCNVVGSATTQCERSTCVVDVSGGLDCEESACSGTITADVATGGVTCIDAVCDLVIDAPAAVLCSSSTCSIEQERQATIRCEAGSTCDVALGAASQLLCTDSSCDARCSGSICDVDCAGTSDCAIDCTLAVDRCDIECATPPEDCGDGRFTCGRPC